MKLKSGYIPFAILAAALLFADATAFAQGRRGQSPRPTTTNAQQQQYRLEITPFYGYQMGGRTYYTQGEVNIADTEVYGVHIGVPTPFGAVVEFLYSHQPTRLDGVYSPPFEPSRKQKLFDMNVDYYMIGALRPLRPGPTQPFGIVYLGAANMRPTSGGHTDEWFFAAGLGGGVKARLNPRLGLRIQGRLMMPLRFSGGGLWCGVGGCNIGVGASSSILQLDLNAGLVIYL